MLYSTQTQAVAALMRLRSKGEERIHTYKCPYGNHWHVGHLPKSIRIAIEKSDA